MTSAQMEDEPFFDLVLTPEEKAHIIDRRMAAEFASGYKRGRDDTLRLWYQRCAPKLTKDELQQLHSITLKLKP